MIKKIKFEEKSYEEIYHHEYTITCATKVLYNVLFEINGKIRQFNGSKYQTQIPDNEERIDVTKKIWKWKILSFIVMMIINWKLKLILMTIYNYEVCNALMLSTILNYF